MSAPSLRRLPTVPVWPRRSPVLRTLDWVAAHLCNRWTAGALLLAVAAVVAGELARHTKSPAG